MRRHAPDGRWWLRVLWAAATLLGLFAMHGMSDHGTMHAATVGAPAVAPHSVHRTVGHGEPMTVVSDAAVTSDGWPDHPTFPMVPMCVAVLALSLLALAVGSRARLRRPSVRAPTLPAAQLRAREFVRRPPDLLALSIQRC